MFITHTVHIPHPIEDCVSALARGPRSWFPSLEDDGSSLVGIKVAGVPVKKRVGVVVGNVIKDGSWAQVSITWKATAGESLFPIFDGKLQLAPVDSKATRLTLSGMYAPPLGRIGLELDDAVMHRVADATVKDLARSISRQLNRASG
jgi:hypothetical protein